MLFFMTGVCWISIFSKLTDIKMMYNKGYRCNVIFYDLYEQYDNTGAPQVNLEFNNIQQNNIPYNQSYMNQPNMAPQYLQAYPNQIQQGNQDNSNKGTVFLIVFFFCCRCYIGPCILVQLFT